MQPTRLLFHIGNLGPRARIGLCHLPLTVVLAALVVSVPSMWPTLWDSHHVRAGLACYAVLVASCWLVPWERLPAGAPLAIPLGDLAAVGLLHHGTVDILHGLAVLAVFPVIWLSVSGMPFWVAGIISFTGPLLIVRAGMPLPAHNADVQLTSSVLLPVMLLAVCLAIRSVTDNVGRQQRQLERKDRELRALLLSSNERERLLGTILDTVDVGIVAVDAEGNTVLTNERMKQLAGPAASGAVPSGAGPSGAGPSGAGPATMDPSGAGPSGARTSSVQDFILHAQDRETVLPAAKRPVQRAIDGEEFGDYVVWAGEGSGQRAFSTAARTMPARDGGFGGAAVAFSEVTSLYEAVLAKDDLVANVSHDLRAPLTSILGNLDLVLEELDDDGEASLRSVAQYLRYSHRSAERLLELVSDLLLSASAATSIHPRPTDLAGLVESCIGSVLPQAQAANVSIAADVPSPLWAHVDPMRITQVLDNLVSNAIKYSPDGGEVRIAADTDGREATLEVRDAGRGMSPQDASRAFDKFFRSAAVREAAISGTGLGLSIAKAIVDRHGGRIHCTSSLGEGTVMQVVLPVEPAVA